MHVAAGGEGALQRVHTTPAMARANYDSLASYYDIWSSYEAPHVEAGIEALGLKVGELVLELGCGTGKAAVQLAEAVQPGGRYVGLDISDGMLAKARARLESAGLASCSTVAVADATQPFPSLSNGSEPLTQEPPGKAPVMADAIFLSFTLELIDTPQIPVVLGSCHAALRAGGRLVLVCMSKGRGRGGMALRMYEWAHDAFPRTVDCRPIEPAPLLKAAGFTVGRVEERSVYGLPVDVVVAEKP